MYVLDQRHRKTSVMSSVSDDNVSVITSADGDGIFKGKEYHDGNIKLGEFPLECTREVMCLRFDGIKYIAVGQADGIIRIFLADLDKIDTYVQTLVDDDVRNTLPVTAIRFKPSFAQSKVEHTHILIATYASGLIKYWHYTSGECIATIWEEKEFEGGEARQTLSLSISPTTNEFITCGADTSLHVYDLETKALIATHNASDSRKRMDGHRMRVFAIKHHPHDGRQFITGGWDDTVQFWDARESHAIRRFYGPHICGDALDIDATHDHILTGSWRKDKTLQIWDYKTASLIKDVPPDNLYGSQLYCCQWVGKENIVCGGCDQNLTRIIDRGTLNTVGQISRLPQGVFCLDNDRQGNKPKMAVGSANKVYMFKMDKKTG